MARPNITIRRCARSEEHTSELQSPFLISYAVFCLKKKKAVFRKKFVPERDDTSLFVIEGTDGRLCFYPELYYEALFATFFFNVTATTDIYTRKDTLSLHDALPISSLLRYSLRIEHAPHCNADALRIRAIAEDNVVRGVTAHHVVFGTGLAAEALVLGVARHSDYGERHRVQSW